MRELAGEYNGFQYDMSFIPDGEKTICVLPSPTEEKSSIYDLKSSISFPQEWRGS